MYSFWFLYDIMLCKTPVIIGNSFSLLVNISSSLCKYAIVNYHIIYYNKIYNNNKYLNIKVKDLIETI